jgi:hypothetical protein
LQWYETLSTEISLYCELHLRKIIAVAQSCSRERGASLEGNRRLFGIFLDDIDDGKKLPTITRNDLFNFVCIGLSASEA